MFVSRRYRIISEIYVLDGLEVIHVRKLLIERTPCGQNFEQRFARHRFDDQPAPFLSQQDLATRKLEVSRDSDRLIAPIAEQACDSFGLHSILPAARAAYAEA